jgi:transcriptional regulator MraZ
MPVRTGQGTWLGAGLEYEGQGFERPPRPRRCTGPSRKRRDPASDRVAFVFSVVREAVDKRMERFVSTFTNKIDAKGRVSIPAPFRAVLERDGYAHGSAGGIYCYPALEAPALDAGGERLAKKIDGLLSGLPDYSDERDELSVALYGDVLVLAIDGDGRISLPENLRAHARLTAQVTFVGLGDKFQMWEPSRFADRRERAREKVQHTRKLFGAGNRPSKSEDDGSDGARG